MMLIYLALGAAGAVTMYVLRNKILPAPPTVLLFVLVIGMALYVHNRSEDDTAQREHDTCLLRVERSAGNRQQWQFLIGVLQTELPKRTDLVNNLTDSLDLNLPALDAADC
jgi:hypothetical protein